MSFASRHDGVSRRRLLRAAGLTAAVAPLGLAATSVLAGNRLGGFPSDALAPPVCKASASVPVTVVSGAPRKLKLTWNATAICTVGVPVAVETGLLRQAQPRGRADQLRRLHRPVAGGHRHRQGRRRHRHGAALAEAAGAGLRRQDHHRHPWRLHAAVGRKTTGITADRPQGQGIGCTDLAAPDQNFFSIRRQARPRPEQRRPVEGFPGRPAARRAEEGRDPGLLPGRSARLGDARARRPASRSPTTPPREYAHRVLRAGRPRQPDPRRQAAAAAITQALLEAQEFVSPTPTRRRRSSPPTRRPPKPTARRHAAEPHAWSSPGRRGAEGRNRRLYPRS